MKVLKMKRFIAEEDLVAFVAEHNIVREDIQTIAVVPRYCYIFYYAEE